MGAQRELVVVGTALSPEFIYTIGPGETITDNRRFGVIWNVRESARQCV